MNRRELLSALGLASLCQLAGRAAEPQLHEPDLWVGTYVKYARYDTQRSGQFGEAQTITITKDRDGYSLGKPYAGRHFREVKKGVLSDGQGGLGTIYLGSAEYVDGMKIPILRAEFCYEWFVLYRDGPRAKAKPPVTTEK